jgi:hypothetical protein
VILFAAATADTSPSALMAAARSAATAFGPSAPVILSHLLVLDPPSCSTISTWKISPIAVALSTMDNSTVGVLEKVLLATSPRVARVAVDVRVSPGIPSNSYLRST